MKNSLLFRMVVLVMALTCALGASAQEAYAVFTSDNTTLTFYYDYDRSSRTGTTYDLNNGAFEPGWVTDRTNTNVKQVVFDPSFADARPTSTYFWFYEMRNLESIIGIYNLNTSEVTRMDGMFMRCYKLKALYLGGFNTSKVTDLSEMFRSCSALQTIYVGDGWRMTDMALNFSRNVFKDCNSLVGGQGTTYDANHVDADYAHIDGGTSNPGYLSNVVPEAYVVFTWDNMTLTFYYDNYRNSRPGTIYDLNTGDTDTGWDTDYTRNYVTQVVFDPLFAGARPTTTYDWFNEMINLESITGLEYLNTSEVTNMAFMFCNCEKLASVDVSHFNTSKVTSMRGMFHFNKELTSLDMSSFNTSQVTDMTDMFVTCRKLQTIFVGSGWTTDAVDESRDMFFNCRQLVGGQGTAYNDFNPTDKTYAHVDGGSSDPGYFTLGNEAYAVYTLDNSTLTFYYDKLRSTREGTTYDLNIAGNNTGWYTDGTNSNVTKVVFDPSFANARPTSTYGWFHNMWSIESITGMEYLNTSEVTDMGYMFMNCIDLTSLDLSHFNTSKVTNMSRMFTSCTSLTRLDLSSFNTSKVANVFKMFANDSHLQTIYVGRGWSTDGITISSEEMFLDCYSLVGGKGTTYNANHVDAAYAHIDGGSSNPGYFTEKKAGQRGDVNGDGEIDVADVTSLISMILNNSAEINIVNNVNGDDAVDVADVTALINYILTGTWPEVDPQSATETFTVNGVTFTMVAVKGGTFTMGATPEQGDATMEDEKPAHQVTLSNFKIGQTEVTQALWLAVMGENPSNFPGDLERPVEMVSWYECQTFINTLNQITGRNFKLPTEAQWEFAARGGNLSKGYMYAGSNTLDDVAWYYYDGCTDLTTHPVGTKAPNELGLYDMSGNVKEWCFDEYAPYSSEPQTDPTGPTGDANHVYRGGSWASVANECRVAFRYSHRYWSNSLGLRLAL